LGLAYPRFSVRRHDRGELLAEYPGLTHEDVLAAIAYGAEAARERIIPVSTENAA